MAFGPKTLSNKVCPFCITIFIIVGLVHLKFVKIRKVELLVQSLTVLSVILKGTDHVKGKPGAVRCSRPDTLWWSVGQKCYRACFIEDFARHTAFVLSNESKVHVKTTVHDWTKLSILFLLPLLYRNEKSRMPMEKSMTFTTGFFEIGITKVNAQ